jgi:hypothetical protein
MAEWRDMESAPRDGTTVACADCRRPYGDEHGFPDLVIPYEDWVQISPRGDGSGLLCPSCICGRLHARGLRCVGAFTSGPITSVSEPTLSALRRAEDIRLEIERRFGPEPLPSTPETSHGG